MNVLLLQLDGKLPNIALMRIAAHQRAIGHAVELRHARTVMGVQRCLGDDFDQVYASLIFTKTKPLATALRGVYPKAIIGGTGWDFSTTVEQYGITTLAQDYSDYPAYHSSLGFTQRGCRLSCGFCVVPEKEGKVKEVASILDIWRGDPWPRELHLLDNDFFGQPEWAKRIEEIRAGRFKVSFNQGINARMISDEAAAAIASVDYRDDSMSNRRIYTAWDSIGDERPLFRGLEALKRHGVKPDHVMVYMLIGYNDTEADRLYRQRRLREFGCRPYPMPYRRTPDLIGFQRWVVRRADLKVSWSDFKAANCRPEKLKRVEMMSLSLFG